jgi:hypothetical protein
MPNLDVRLTALLQQRGKILLSLVEGYFWCHEAKSLSGVNLNELAHPPSQHSSDEDIRVKNDHLNASPPSRAAASA